MLIYLTWMYDVVDVRGSVEKFSEEHIDGDTRKKFVTMISRQINFEFSV